MTFLAAPVKVNYTQATVRQAENSANLVSGISRMKQWGMSPTSITICFQTREVHRNCNAPCDYTYTGSIKKGSYT